MADSPDADNITWLCTPAQAFIRYDAEADLSDAFTPCVYCRLTAKTPDGNQRIGYVLVEAAFSREETTGRFLPTSITSMEYLDISPADWY